MELLLEDDGPDTALARALHDDGVVPLKTLRACLDEVRARRPFGASLASLLLDQGLASVSALEAAARRVEATWSDRPGGGGKAPQPLPERVGPYRIVRELGQGGMGTVYEAVHEPTGAVRALKTLRKVDPEHRARFRLEVEALARLDHPHVARVHEASVDAEPFWLAQDLLPGGSLQERLARGPMALEEAVRLTIKLALALQHAHERGVVHRDVKPSNVLFDDRGEPRLMDFGLARCVEKATRLTATGALLGTPTYMAPEQARGEDADAATDVYALALVLWALLAGRAPFMGGTLFQVLEQVVRFGVPPIASRRPDVPPPVARALRRATLLGRKARTASAAAFAAELEAALAPAPPRRPLGPWLAVGALAALGALAGAVAAGGRGRAAPPPAAATAPAAPVATPVAPWNKPAWLARLESDRDLEAVRAADRAIAEQDDPRARAATVAALTSLDAAWREPPPGDAQALAACELFLAVHSLWKRLEPEHRLEASRVDGLASVLVVARSQEAAAVAEAVRALAALAPDHLAPYLAYVEVVRGLSGRRNDVALLRAGVALARERRAAGEQGPELGLLIEALSDSAIQEEEQVPLAREVLRDGHRAPRTLLRASVHVPPDEGLAMLERAEAMGLERATLLSMRAFVHAEHHLAGGGQAPWTAALADAQRALELLEAQPQRQRPQELRRVAQVFTLLSPPAQGAAACARVLRVAGPEALAEVAVWRVELLLRTRADAGVLADAVAELLRRVDGRVAALGDRGDAAGAARARAVRARLREAGTDREALAAALAAAQADRATWNAVADLSPR